MTQIHLGMPEMKTAERENLTALLHTPLELYQEESQQTLQESPITHPIPSRQNNLRMETTQLDPSMPLTGPLIDRLGRIVHDLRISLTDKCNLRCTYCMPQTDITYITSKELLLESHFQKIIRCALEVGITTFRFTGGEPLLSPLAVPLIGYTSSYATQLAIPIDIALTTNGIHLAEKIDSLVERGLRRVTVSIDTVNQKKFTDLTSKNKLHLVMQGIQACRQKNIPLKLNAVMYNTEALDDIPELLAFAGDKQVPIRFIEQMPLSPGIQSTDNAPPTVAHLRSILENLGTLIPSRIPRDSAPAQMYTFIPNQHFIQEYALRYAHSSDPIEIGIIAAMSEPFCSQCDRTRVTSDGKVRNCLFSSQEYSLNTSNKDWNTLTESEIILNWRKAMWEKSASYINPTGHISIPIRGMNAIGG